MSIVLSAEEIEAMTPGAQWRWWQRAPRDHWERMVITPDTPAVHWKARHPNASGPGIYLLAGADGGIDYIGKSKDLAQRIDQHCLGMQYGREPAYHSYSCIQLPIWAYHDIEAAHISALEPPNNKLNRGGSWPFHDELIKVIHEAWGYKP